MRPAPCSQPIPARAAPSPSFSSVDPSDAPPLSTRSVPSLVHLPSSPRSGLARSSPGRLFGSHLLLRPARPAPHTPPHLASSRTDTIPHAPRLTRMHVCIHLPSPVCGFSHAPAPHKHARPLTRAPVLTHTCTSPDTRASPQPRTYPHTRTLFTLAHPSSHSRLPSHAHFSRALLTRTPSHAHPSPAAPRSPSGAVVCGLGRWRSRRCPAVTSVPALQKLGRLQQALHVNHPHPLHG